MFGLDLSPDVYVTATRPTDVVALYARLSEGTSKQEAVARLRGLRSDWILYCPDLTGTRGPPISKRAESRASSV